MTDYATHPDYIALLRGVCEDPADDLPRLVLADYLDENGHGDRAELIRVQVEIGSMHWARGGGVCMVPGFAPPPELRRLAELQRRERESEPPCRITIREFPTAFSVSVNPDAGMHDLPHATLARGFVASIRLAQAQFLVYAAAVFSRHPVTAVTLSDQAAYPTVADGRVAWFHPDVPSGNQPRTQRIGADLFRALAGYRNGGASPARVKWYDSRRDADAALSHAAANWGRSQVTPPLPPLPVPA